MATLNLPTADRRIEASTTGEPLAFARPERPFTRVAYSAAHVVADPLADGDPWVTPAIDWDATIRYRHYLWDLGLGVAEAMDTAQRGMGLGWPEAKELIAGGLEAAKGRPGALIACGAGTDHLAAGPEVTRRRRDPRLRGADRDGGEPWRADHPDGEPGAGGGGDGAGRLRAGLRPDPAAGARSR